MAGLRTRFRKSFTIIPGILKWTISKKGTSLNFNLGPFSKTWGTRGNTTTIDAPGAFGLSWRKEERKGQNGEKGHQADGSHPLWLTGSVVVILLHLLVGLARIYIHPLATCAREGSPFVTWVLICAAEAVLVGLIWGLVPRLRGFLVFLMVLTLASWGMWELYNAQIAELINCAKR